MLLFLKNLLFTVLAPGTVAFYIPLLIVTAGHSTFNPASTVSGLLGLIPLVMGTSIYLWCAWDFATFGRGTPAPIDAPKRLVVRGLYRYVRNPMYLGVLLVLLGWTLFFISPRLLLYATTVGLVFHLFTILYEEPTLRRTFGAEYEAYIGRVNRWIPRLPQGEAE